MICEKSCGAIVYTKDGDSIKYVIVCNKQGIYGFPKGHIESGEREEETALREIFEETGLSVSLIEGFREEDSHTFSHYDETRLKHITYFLAEYSGQTPKAQEEELSDISLLTFEDATSRLQYESSKRILKNANDYLIG